MKKTLLVTGASGHLGRRVVEHLLTKGQHRIIATTRTPDKLADLDERGVEVRRGSFDEDTAAIARTFAGAERLLVISTDTIDGNATRLRQHERAVAAAQQAGVRHVVYTSLTNADTSPVSFAADHAGTERALATSGLGYSILRNNWYSEYLFPALQHAIKTGQLIGAAGNGGAGYVTREDCAIAAAGALARDVDEKRIYEVTGPAVVDYDTLAAITSRVTGKAVRYVEVPLDAYIQGLVQAGVPAGFAHALGTFQTALRTGSLAVATDAVVTLGGGKPTSIEAFLEASRGALGA